MKKIFTLVLFLASSFAAGHAQKALVIKKADGSSVEQTITNQTKLRFAADSMMVCEDDVQLLAVSMSDVARLQFGQATGIHFVTPGEESALRLVQSGDNLYVKGLAKPAGASLYQMSGRLCACAQLAPGAPLSLAQLPGGIYFLKVDNAVFKFIKK